MNIDRLSYDSYFMKIAEVVASRSSCNRKNVGAVIVVNKTLVSTGYNGAPRGMPHCDDPGVGHLLVEMGGRASCVRSVHAEVNAIAQAARTGVRVEGGTLHTTASPCYECLKVIINAGIIKVVCKEFYASRYGMSDEVMAYAEQAGLEFVIEKTQVISKEEPLEFTVSLPNKMPLKI